MVTTRALNRKELGFRWRRHELNHRALVAGVEAMGLRMAVPEGQRLWSLNAISVHEGVGDSGVEAADSTYNLAVNA